MRQSLARNKKGELQALYGYIMWFIIIAILLGIGLLVLVKINDKTADQLTETSDERAFSESTAAYVRNFSYTTLTGINKNPSCKFVKLTVMNATNFVPANNYTTTGCTIKAVGLINWSNGVWALNGTFTYDVAREKVAYTTVNTTIKEVGGYADWFGIVVIVTVAALILGIVLRAFVFRRPQA